MTSPQLKEQKAEELINILSKHFSIDLKSVQTQNILTHIKKEMLFYEATEECQKLSKDWKTA